VNRPTITKPRRGQKEARRVNSDVITSTTSPGYPGGPKVPPLPLCGKAEAKPFVISNGHVFGELGCSEGANLAITSEGDW